MSDYSISTKEHNVRGLN